MQRIFVITGNQSQYVRFLRETGSNTTVFPPLFSVEKMMGLQKFDYILYGEYWLNPTYNSPQFNFRKGRNVKILTPGHQRFIDTGNDLKKKKTEFVTDKLDF